MNFGTFSGHVLRHFPLTLTLTLPLALALTLPLTPTPEDSDYGDRGPLDRYIDI